MTNRDEFIGREILPALGEYADDFDIDAICDEVSDFDEREGYTWKAPYDATCDEYDADAFWAIVAAHDVSAS